jgi:sugar (pentulose or hexulose) kinase
MATKLQTNKDLILVFDGGTQSIRCGLFDIKGRMVDFIKLPFQPYFSEQPGFAEQHPEYFWEKFYEVSRQLLTRNTILTGKLVAVTLTTQRGVYINLDRNGVPLRPDISWLDKRQADQKRFAPLWLEAGLRISNTYGVVDKLYRKCFSNWIKQHQPEVWEKTYKYVLLSGYFLHQLTGNFIESMGTNFGYLPIDRKSFGWTKKNDIIWFAFPIEKDKLPDIVVQGDTIGMITHQAAQDTGIPEGLPVIAADCDKFCEVLGAGILDSDVGCLSFGTYPRSTQ